MISQVLATTPVRYRILAAVLSADTSLGYNPTVRRQKLPTGCTLSHHLPANMLFCPAAVKRPSRIILILLTFTAVLTLILLSTLKNGAPWHRLVGGSLRTPPPTYDEILWAEYNLPQHNLSLPYPEGRTGRYIKFSNQIKGLGWNNVLNEMYAHSALSNSSDVCLSLAACSAAIWPGVRTVHMYSKTTSGILTTTHGTSPPGRGLKHH